MVTAARAACVSTLVTGVPGSSPAGRVCGPYCFWTHGLAERVESGRDLARRDKARRGKVGFMRQVSVKGCLPNSRGRAWHGLASRGKAGHGKASRRKVCSLNLS